MRESNICPARIGDHLIRRRHESSHLSLRRAARQPRDRRDQTDRRFAVPLHGILPCREPLLGSVRILRGALYTNIAVGNGVRQATSHTRSPASAARERPASTSEIRDDGRAPMYNGTHPGPVHDPGFKFLGEDHAMRCRTGLKSAALGLLGASALATTLYAQEGAGAAKPWRGAGPTPCYGTDGGANKCLPAPQVVAVRAGQLVRQQDRPDADEAGGAAAGRAHHRCRARKRKSRFPPAPR